MLKKIIIGTAFCFGLILSFQQSSFAQDKTKDELKAERDSLKLEMKSKDAQDRQAKMEKLSPPSNSGVSSVDQLAGNSTKLLTSTKDINKSVPEMYKRTIGETTDGVTDVTVKKPTAGELLDLSKNIGQQIAAVAAISAAVPGATSDVKSAGPMQSVKATKSLNYSKDVVALTGPELKQNLKVVNNLIATLKSSNNN